MGTLANSEDPDGLLMKCQNVAFHQDLSQHFFSHIGIGL